jgi:hypothetical protein
VVSAAPDRAPYQDEAAAVFLKTLFCDESAWIDVRHILEGDVRREPCHGRAAALAEIQRAAELARNVYVGVASRRNGLRGKRAGGKKNLRDVAALWVDVDHREEGDRELLEVTLESFPLPPSMRIWSTSIGCLMSLSRSTSRRMSSASSKRSRVWRTASMATAVLRTPRASCAYPGR